MSTKHMPWETHPASPRLIRGDGSAFDVGAPDRARRIVQCVNAHDDLVAALAAIVGANGEPGGLTPERLRIARAALAKAGVQA